MTTARNTNSPDAAPPADGPYVLDSGNKKIQLFLGAAGLLLAFGSLLNILGLHSGHGDWDYVNFVVWLGMGLVNVRDWNSKHSLAIIGHDGLTCPWRFSGTLPWRFVRSCERRLTGGEPLRITVDPQAYKIIRAQWWPRPRHFDVYCSKMTDPEVESLLSFCAASIAEAEH